MRANLNRALVAKKRRLITTFFLTIMFLTIISLPIGIAGANPVASNGGSVTNSACSVTKASQFFSFPTWYEYLPGVTDQNGKCQPSLAKLSDIWLIVAAIVDILLRVGALAAVGMVIYGGIRYTTSMGSPELTAKARTVIIDALIGLIITIMASFFITFLAGSIS